MTKDGFVFLAMGFTGKKASQLKEAYIGAFNAMAEQLNSRSHYGQWQAIELREAQSRVHASHGSRLLNQRKPQKRQYFAQLLALGRQVQLALWP